MQDVRENDPPPEPLVEDLRERWALRPDIAFLNHGSFGATPRAVLAEQDAWRMRIEAEPIEMLGRRNFHLIAAAKEPVGRWLGMREQDFGLITNATEGVNAVLKSLTLSPGDELLTTTHVYHAVRQAMRLTANRAGAVVRELSIPLPVASADQIAEAVLNGISARTRLLVIDHVTSPTALVFPMERIIAGCAAAGVEVLVDGAHAPGMVPLQVDSLGATYYAANLHKWCCAPKGCALLWVAPHRQEQVHPLVVSHWLGDGFSREFGWQGTRDLSAWLTIPAALKFMADLGWNRVMDHNHQMASWAHRMLCSRWNVEPISPLDGSLLGSTATMRLPGKLAELLPAELEMVQERLYQDFQIEVPFMGFAGQSYLRVSCQVYNRAQEYERLADVVLKFA